MAHNRLLGFLSAASVLVLFYKYRVVQVSQNSPYDNRYVYKHTLYQAHSHARYMVVVMLHNALPTGHETYHNGCTHQGEYLGCRLSIFEVVLRRYSTVSEAFLRPRITT
jgi:hypothetical protein